MKGGLEECIRDWDGSEEGTETVAQLAHGNLPGIGLKAQVENNLRRDAVDSTVEDPSEEQYLSQKRVYKERILGEEFTLRRRKRRRRGQSLDCL